jgi:hypothetical protein
VIESPRVALLFGHPLDHSGQSNPGPRIVRFSPHLYWLHLYWHLYF